MVRVSKAIALCVAIMLPMAGHADDKDAVKYRQHIMKSLQEQTAAFGQILSGVGPAENTQAHMDALALSASLAMKSFQEKVPGGAAKSEVWSNYADFSERMKDFADKSAEMAKTGREKGVDVALTGVLEALSCKSCHDLYRDEK